MDRITKIAIVISIFIIVVPHVGPLYSQAKKPQLVIPKEYQQELISNQNKIDDYRKLAEAAYARNEELLGELLILNGIKEKEGEKWMISLNNGIWKLYKK